MPNPPPPVDKGAFTLPEFRHWSGLGRTKALEEIAAGRLHAVKVGRRLLIPVAAAQRWLAERPPARHAAATALPRPSSALDDIHSRPPEPITQSIIMRRRA